ncbi:unnamed protein product [Dibothriocephalus latus]|uniref:Uncharacterized protein n=1 Tax=Dibothriocephalus latus TaxID=60516 RepID=A0A3P7NQA9_DIBLA|nr:unnamed protein product [Dibothriocephalus latus]
MLPLFLKVKVILCVRLPNCPGESTKGSSTSGASSLASNVMPSVSIDPRRKQVTLIHPAPSRRRFSLAAPKMFAFDAVLTQEDPLKLPKSLIAEDFFLPICASQKIEVERDSKPPFSTLP